MLNGQTNTGSSGPKEQFRPVGFNHFARNVGGLKVGIERLPERPAMVTVGIMSLSLRLDENDVANLREALDQVSAVAFR